MKRKSGNVSILVIFVLLASSLLGILSMNFVKQMMEQSAVVTAYYKSYYLAKAWIELWLSQISHRDVGFEYTVHTWDRIVRDNFFVGQEYELFTSISGTSALLSHQFWQSSGCDHPYEIAPGESFILPLFRDSFAASVIDTFMPPSYTNLALLFKNNQITIDVKNGGEVTYGMLILSWSELALNGAFFRPWTLSQWLDSFKDDFERYLSTIDASLYPTESLLYKNYDKSWLIDNGFALYLMISNTSDTKESFCLSVQQSMQLPTRYVLPTDEFFLYSQASYAHQTVALEASYAQPIPGFLFSAYTDY